MERRNVIGFLIVVVLIGFNLTCWAAEYPSRSIQMISPYSAGGPLDLGVKMISQGMSKYLGQTIVPINKPGGSTTVGAKYVVSRDPDGYTLLGASSTTMNFFPKVVKDAGYTVEDLIGLFGHAEVALYLMVKAESPWKTLNDYVDDARKHPNEFRHASWGAYSFGNLGMALINNHFGIQTRHVPFTNTPPAINALLGGHVDIFLCAGVVQGLMEAKKLRCLASTSAQRSIFVPDVPTLRELGVPFVITFHHGFFVRKETPKNIQEKVIQAGRKASMEDPEGLKKKFFDIGLSPAWADQETYMNRSAEDIRMYKIAIDLLKLPTFDTK